MTELIVNAGIIILLALSVGFGGIGIIGLFVFPDIRSRMYTATRAPVIGIGAMALAGILYALSTFLAGGGDPYLLLVADCVVLLGIVIGANLLIYRMILKRTPTVNSCELSQKPAVLDE
jgi:multisubunit Na+/H+ antiporter MnhG subunit